MKILHVCDSTIGGTGSYLAELLPYQAREYGRGNVALLMPTGHLPYLESDMTESDVQIVTFARKNRLLGMVCLFFAYIYHLLRFRPDVVHAHSFGAGVVIRLLWPLTPARVVFCPHGWAFDMVAPRWRNLLVERIEWVLSLLCDRILMISGHEYERARDIGIAKSKLRIVRSGIAREAPALAPARWDDSRLKLLFVGRFDHQKGLDILLEAIEPLGDQVVLRTVGSSVVSTGFETRPLPFVEHLGWLSRKDVTAQMRACDFLVVPSRWEGFGLVALEAMRLGIPVIASRVGGLREILDNGRFGPCFEPGDAAELRQRLIALTSDKVAEWRHVAHQRFLDAYTSDRMQREIDDLYQDATGGRFVPTAPSPVAPQ